MNVCQLNGCLGFIYMGVQNYHLCVVSSLIDVITTCVSTMCTAAAHQGSFMTAMDMTPKLCDSTELSTDSIGTCDKFHSLSGAEFGQNCPYFAWGMHR